MTRDLPVDLIPTINRIVRTSQRLLNENGREPDTQELAARLAMPLANVERLLAIARGPIRL